MSVDIRNVIEDPQRLATLHDSGLLDSEVEEQFDRLTRLASRLLGVPATFFSLVDADRDFYKSCFGFPEPLATGRELTGVTFCHYSIVSDGALVIPDTRADPRYRTVPTVESLGVAAYLGVPVRAPNGDVLGSFCAIDFEPKDWTPLEVEIMKELAASAEREVALRHWMQRQRELMDREFAARVELERVMESRARLIRGFTHDVKNPLGAGSGFLSLLEEEVLGPLSDQQRDSVRGVRRSIGAALALIDELIDLARSEKGELAVDYEQVDLDAVLQDIADEYRAQAGASDRSIGVVASAGRMVLYTDPVRLRQILGNLVSNALKYAPAGEVTLAAVLRTGTGAPARGEWVAIDVIDRGPGIPSGELHRIFDEFERVAPASAGGAGLGLAISQRLAEALGGNIAVDSVVGVGSTFTLWLPAHGRRSVARPVIEVSKEGAAAPA